ncbi:hypothetical protein PRIC1_004432 [Phytophthora ramorum]
MAPKGAPPKAPDAQRRGSSSFFDRVRLAMQDMTDTADTAASITTPAGEPIVETQEEQSEMKVEENSEEVTGEVDDAPSDDVQGEGEAEEAGEDVEVTADVEVETLSDSEEKPQSEVAGDVEEKAPSQSDLERNPPVAIAAPVALPEPPVNKPAPTSPRASALFGRLMTAMRNELSPPTSPPIPVDSDASNRVEAALTKTTEIFVKDSEEKSASMDTAVVETVEAPASDAEQTHVATEETAGTASAVETVTVAGTSDNTVEETPTNASAEAAADPVTETTTSAGELSDRQKTKASFEVGAIAAINDTSDENADDPEGVGEGGANSSDSHDAGSAPLQEQNQIATPVPASPLQQEEVPKPVASPPTSSSRLFGRLISAMRTEPADTRRPSVSATTANDRETDNGSSINSSTFSGISGNRVDSPPPSTSIFDRLISTVRQEAPAPTSTTDTAEPAYIPHAEITVDEHVANDVSEAVANSDVGYDEASESAQDALQTGLDVDIPQESMTPEAAAIEEMVELTLDVGGDDQDETHDAEPSTSNDNETVAENHNSEPSVTNEIDHVEEHYPVELQNAIQRTGSAMLSVLPGLESAGISAECFNAVERMKTDGEIISMEFVKELETAGVLMTCANKEANQTLQASEENLAELRAAIAACCTGKLSWTAVPELLALWSIVHTSVSAGISDDVGEKANVVEPFEITRAAERKGTVLEEATEHEKEDEVEVDNSLFDEQLAHAALTHAMSGLQGSLLVSRQRLATTLQAMREGRAALVGGCLALVNIPPLLRLEIARDFFQTAGLFLSGMFKPTLKYFDDYDMPEYVSMLVKGLRAAYTIIAVDVSAFIQWVSKSSDVGVFISIGVLMVAHVVFIGWLYKITRYMPRGADNVRHGHEATTWATLAATNKRMAMLSSFLITASLTAYLPLTQFCFTVLDISAHQGDKTPNNQGTVASHFRDKPYWGLIVFEAIALLVTFSIPLPFVLVSSIRSNRPRGSLENAKVTYDLDGEQVPFDNKVYARLVASDPSQLRCPYRSLYNGFEQRWSTYKVLQLVAKAILAAVVVAAGRNVSTGGIVVCGVYFMVVALTSYSRPFIDPVNDLMESSAKFTALVTAVGGTAGAWAQRNDIHSGYLEGFLAFVLFVHFVNLWVMLTVTMLGVANTRTLIKGWLGWLSFSDTTRMIEDARAQDIIPKWDLNKEAKHRVWQAFWRAVLYDLSHNEVNASEHSEDQIKNSPAAARLINLDQSVVTAGIRRVSSHWRGKQQRYTTRLRQVVRTALEGVDVYWNEDTGVRDGHLDSKSFFGKMYVVPYPFHCVIVFDNTNDEAIIWDEVDESAPRDNKLHSNLAKLLFLNFSPSIVAKRELRQKIRALADLKTPVRFAFSRVEKAVVTDYYMWTPIEGGKPMKIHYKAVVDFTCHYTYGVFKVKTSGDSTIKGGDKRAMADGFVVSLTYKDGRGYAKAPKTGKRIEITGRKAVCDSDHFGLNPDMEENEHLKQIFEQTRPSWELGIKKMRAEHREYRRRLIAIHADANAILSDDFWYFVYNNQYLSRQDLEQYLTTREVNPLMRQLPQTHKIALDALYLRQRFIMLSPAHKLWYIFWDDVYARNSDMSRLIPKGEPKPGRACRSDFDPNSASSICYKKMNRTDLEAWLAERRLLSKTGMFHPGLLHLLYDEMRKLDEGADPKNIMKVRPGGRSFKRRSMIASMVWRPAA